MPNISVAITLFTGVAMFVCFSMYLMAMYCIVG